MTILTPHELATLMVVHHAPDQIDVGRTELDTLMQYQLITFVPLAGEVRRPMLTASGRALLNTIAWPEPQGFPHRTAPQEIFSV
jgi:hypothetical protein